MVGDPRRSLVVRHTSLDEVVYILVRLQYTRSAPKCSYTDRKGQATQRRILTGHSRRVGHWFRD